MKLPALLSFTLLATATLLISSCSSTNPAGVVSTPAVQHVYVVCDQCTGSNTPSEVLTYAVNSSSAAPVTTLTSPAGQHWKAVATDSSGNIYVVSATGSTSSYAYSILVYAAGSTGTATPARTITSSSIAQASFGGMIVAPNGTIYYVDGNYGLEEYPATANGVSTPTVINGKYFPSHGAVDSAGNIFFGLGVGGIGMLPSNFTSSSTAIEITATQFVTDNLGAVSLDSAGNLYAYLYPNYGGPVTQLVELPHTTTPGSVTPTKVITLPKMAPTSFAMDAAPAVDSSGNIYLYTNLSPIIAAEIAFSATTGTPTPINTITTTLVDSASNAALIVH